MVGAAALVLLSVGLFLGCEVEGPSCCALKSFCTACSTCTSDDLAAANKKDETACKAVVEKYRSMKQFCNPDDKPPQHTIEEFVLQCGG